MIILYIFMAFTVITIIYQFGKVILDPHGKRKQKL